MNAAVKRQHSSAFLPEITTHSNKWRKGTQHRWKRDSLQTGLVLDKSAQILSKEETARSFSELFSLLRSDQDRRAAAEPGSALSLQTPLEEQQDKLETIKLHLCQAEQAERTENLEQARQQAEMCLKQAEDSGWLDSAGQPLRLRACQLLGRIHSQLADASLAASNYQKALTLLHEGYSMAAESQDKQVEGEAAYRLGLAYQCTGDHDTAKKFFNTCMQIFGTLQDADGLGKAYKAMAKSLESQGNIDGTVHCLEELADISRRNGLQYNLVDACLCLGNIFCTMHQYRRACESFLQGYDVACHIGDVALLQKAQVLLASARAHSMITKYSADVKAATPVALKRLMAWKETERHRELSADYTDHTASVWY
ncbi:Tetratricopeptide repeat protein 29 [Channa argus]|uniref:Tetratricopeptide repeat protein 29 n=1 Tax=Channa argus TaxID=215402 RepID=A0A6G1Q5Z6_CHAAH|nr:Tetratricopeptide repeat protein 29 [Channa argus]